MTHGVFSAEAASVIDRSSLERLVLLDTIQPPRLEPALLRRVELLDCAPMLATAIARLHEDGSLSPITEL